MGVRGSALQVLCQRCGLYVYFQKDLEGLPGTIEMHKANRAQIVTCIVNEGFALKKILLGSAGVRFVPINSILLAREFVQGKSVEDLGYDIHLFHPHNVTAMAPRAQARTMLPDQPPF